MPAAAQPAWQPRQVRRADADRQVRFHRALDSLLRAAKLAGKQVVVEIRDQRPVKVVTAVKA